MIMRHAVRALLAAASLSGCVLFGLDPEDYSLAETGGGGAATAQTGTGGGGEGGGSDGNGGAGGGAAPTCSDGAANGQETGTDCGGPSCATCPAGEGCSEASDCESRVCTAGVCAAPACDDGVQNGEEDLATDCGGGCPCATGQACVGNADCASLSCVGGTCAAPSCNDAILNGAESDVDCGGQCPLTCPVGAACFDGADCQESVCEGNICQAPDCGDGTQNGTESDVDCGGSCAADCAEGQGCASGADCASLVCGVSGLCVQASCGDGQQNGGETDVDCGGPCGATCGTGGGCNLGGDCVDQVCANGTCAVPTCGDGVSNGSETGTDCGGGCPSCAPGAPCNLPSDCTSLSCVQGVCQPPSCVDGIENGGESDVDCGGGCALCDNGLGCSGDADCATGSCSGGACAPWALRSLSPYFEDAPPQSVSVLTSGDVLLTGLFNGDGFNTLAFGSQSVVASTGFEAFILRTSRGGQPLAMTSLSAPGSDQVGLASAAGPGGRFAIGGHYTGSFSTGAVTLPAPSTFDGFVVSFDAAGVAEWGYALTPGTHANVMDLAYFGGGDIVVGGSQSGTGTTIGGEGGYLGDAVVVRLAGSTGTPVWTKVLIGSGPDGDLVRAVSVDPAGDVLIAGEYGTGGGGTLDLGGGVVLPAGPTRQGFVAKLDGTTGSAIWAVPFASLGSGVVYDVAVDGVGATYAVGATTGAVTIGGTLSQGAAGGDFDMVVARIAPDGTPAWAAVYGGSALERAMGVALDGAGRIVVSGFTASATVALGGPPFSGAGNKPFVARYQAATGAHSSSRVMPVQGGGATGSAVAVHPTGGSVLLAGGQGGSVELWPGEPASSDNPPYNPSTPRAFLGGLGPNP